MTRGRAPVALGLLLILLVAGTAAVDYGRSRNEPDRPQPSVERPGSGRLDRNRARLIQACGRLPLIDPSSRETPAADLLRENRRVTACIEAALRGRPPSERSAVRATPTEHADGWEQRRWWYAGAVGAVVALTVATAFALWRKGPSGFGSSADR